jgi:hypothetical protein
MKSRRLVSTLFLNFLFATVFLTFQQFSIAQTNNNKSLNLSQMDTASKPVVSKLSTQNFEGQAYQVTLLDDAISELEIDGQNIAPENFNEYKDQVEGLKIFLKRKVENARFKYSESTQVLPGTHPENIKDISNSERLIDFGISRQLYAYGLVKDFCSHYSFKLDNTALIVNGEKQSDKIFQRLKIMFIKSPSEEYSYQN